VRRTRIRLGTPVVAAVATFVVLFTTYLATSAPDLTFWDASEFITAAQTLGIPHPPGTPLWVLLGKVSALVFSNTGPVRSVTMLSVVSGALACALGAAMASRWIGGRGAVAAAVGAGTMFSVWNNATETEVYAVSLLASVVMLFAGERAGRAEADAAARARWRAIIAFVAGLAIPLHLSVLVALPAALVFAWRGHRPRIGEATTLIAIAALGASAVLFLPLRAQHDPLLNAGNPESWRALVDVITRRQYDVPGLWPRRAPLWLQIGNVFQWADWQVAFGVAPHIAPDWKRTPLSILWAWFAWLGIRAAFRHEQRVGRALSILAVSATLGVAIWLNLRAGPSYGSGVLPDGALHEARERDYFFALGFWCWGLLAGLGVVSLAQRLGQRLPQWASIPLIAVAALPIVANGPAADRTREPEAMLPRTTARLLLDAVPQHGVLVVAGDNDTFPLWYLQQVEEYRTDVTVVTSPLLGAQWYRRELHERRGLPADFADSWQGLGPTLAAVGAEARRRNRDVRVSALVSERDRNAVQPTQGWLLEGLVYAPTDRIEANAVGIDEVAMKRARESIPPSILAPLSPSADPIGRIMQEFLWCTTVNSLGDSLLVGRCHGG
jgi:hypothetical protein